MRMRAVRPLAIGTGGRRMLHAAPLAVSLCMHVVQCPGEMLRLAERPPGTTQRVWCSAGVQRSCHQGLVGDEAAP